MLKQFPVFGRGDVADALKYERSQKETLRLHRPGWAFPSPYLLLLFSEGKISRGVNENVVRTNRDREWLQQSILREHWAMYLGSEIKRHLKQDLGTQAMVPIRHFPRGATESWSHSRKRYHIVTCLLFNYFWLFSSLFLQVTVSG